MSILLILHGLFLVLFNILLYRFSCENWKQFFSFFYQIKWFGIEFFENFWKRWYRTEETEYADLSWFPFYVKSPRLLRDKIFPLYNFFHSLVKEADLTSQLFFSFSVVF